MHTRDFVSQAWGSQDLSIRSNTPRIRLLSHELHGDNGNMGGHPLGGGNEARKPLPKIIGAEKPGTGRGDACRPKPRD
jgi:hypothetical protein